MKFKNSKVVGYIYETTDYSLFKKLPSNRDLLLKRLNRLIESFSVREIMNPIVVNKYYQIIDGQGRFEAKKMLHRPIQYVVDEEATIDDCRRMNAYNAPWTLIDYVQSLASDGNDNCQRLLDCAAELNISISRCIRFSNHVNHPSSGKPTTSMALLDKLIFTEEDAEKVKDTWKKTTEIKESLLLSKRLNDAFCVGVKVMIDTDGYDHKSMIQRCSKMKNTFSLASNLEDMLKEFSRIYNSSRAANKRLYFEDYMRNRGYNVRDYNVPINKEKDVSSLKERRSK